MVLVTRTTPLDEVAKPTDGMSLFLVDVDRQSTAAIPKMGRNAVAPTRSSSTTCASPRGPHRRGGQGFRYLLDGLNPERILLAAEALGLGRVALDAR